MRILLFIFTLLLAFNTLASTKIFTANNLAIGGVDVVAYFTDSKPTMGDKQYVTQWQGVTWQFSNEKHLSMFKETPERFAPRFGGFCSLTSAHGASIPVNPMAWAIYNDQLYLFVFERARDTWLMNPDTLIERAESMWTGELSSL